jgi:hypothetical protein
MKQLLLHIGTGKTGTTSIQHTIERAFKEKNLGNIAYPEISGSNHNFIAEVYKDPKRLSRSSRHRYRSELRDNTFTELTSRVRDNLRQWIVKNDCTILSGEYFGGLSDIEIRRFCEDLRRWGVGKVRVLIYIRNPSSYYLSFIQQQLKGSHQITNPGAFKYRFRESIESWQAVITDVVARPFERSSLIGNDVVPDFLRQVSDFFGEVVERDRIEAIRKNESLSAEGMLILQKYRFLFHRSRKNVPAKDSGNLLRILARSQALMKQTKAEISPAVGQLITERHREDIVWLLEHFQIDLSSDEAKQYAPDKSRGHSTNDLESILDSYDEKIFEELLFLCLHESLARTILSDPNYS